MKLNNAKQYVAAMAIRQKLVTAMWSAEGEELHAIHRAAQQMARRVEDIQFGPYHKVY